MDQQPSTSRNGLPTFADIRYRLSSAPLNRMRLLPPPPAPPPSPEPANPHRRCRKRHHPRHRHRRSNVRAYRAARAVAAFGYSPPRGLATSSRYTAQEHWDYDGYTSSELSEPDADMSNDDEPTEGRNDPIDRTLRDQSSSPMDTSDPDLQEEELQAPDSPKASVSHNQPTASNVELEGPNFDSPKASVSHNQPTASNVELEGPSFEALRKEMLALF